MVTCGDHPIESRGWLIRGWYWTANPKADVNQQQWSCRSSLFGYVCVCISSMSKYQYMCIYIFTYNTIYIYIYGISCIYIYTYVYNLCIYVSIISIIMCLNDFICKYYQCTVYIVQGKWWSSIGIEIPQIFRSTHIIPYPS